MHVRGSSPSPCLNLISIDASEQAPISLSGPGPFTVGRSEDCAAQLTHPSASRRHATLSWRADQWLLECHPSRAGSFVNGVEIEPGSSTALREGDVARFGPTSLRVSMGEKEAPAAVVRDAITAGGTIIEKSAVDDEHALDRRRLRVLMEGSASLHEASDETELAEAVLELAMGGTSLRRAFAIRSIGNEEKIDVIAARDSEHKEGGVHSFSKTLSRLALEGSVIRLTQPESTRSESIVGLGVHSAVCCPIILDQCVSLVIYVDARGEEPPCSDGDTALVQAIAQLASLALGRIKQAEFRARKELLENDLQAARHAQETLGPPATGSIGSLRYASYSLPGHFVAGDLFDIFPIDDSKVACYLGDVTGHGVRSAVLMSAVLAYARAAMLSSREPTDAINEVNQYLCERTPSDMFVTMILAVFDLSARTMQYVDAGHGHWLLVQDDERPDLGRHTNGIILGVDPEHEYDSRAIELAPGDRVMFFTDGITESRGPDGGMFGHDRLIEIISRSSSIEEDIDMTLAGFRSFAGEIEPDDDTTILSIEPLSS